MSNEKLTALLESYETRLPEAGQQAWADYLATVSPKTEQQASDILDEFGAFLLDEPYVGVEDVIKRKAETEDETPFERKAATERIRLLSRVKLDDSVKQVNLLAVFSGDGPIQAINANEAKCVGALIREDYLTASAYAGINATDDEAGKYYLVQSQTSKLQELT
jgi:hypothetical protein